MVADILYINWHPDPDFFHSGNFAIKWYGIMWGASLMAAFFIVTWIFKKLHRSEEKVTIAIQYVFIGGLIGARLAHVLFYQLEFYLAHPQDIIAVWKGGLASHGGVVGGLLGLYLFCLRNKEFSFLWVLDMGIIAIPVLASLIRFGNLMNSEIVGSPATVPWAFIFSDVDSIPRHPVVLYESISYLLIQFVMLWLFNRYRDTKPGLYLASFFLLVFTARFMLEFYKEPDGFVIFNAISKTQVLDVPFILAGLGLALLVSKNKLHYHNKPQPING